MTPAPRWLAALPLSLACWSAAGAQTLTASSDICLPPSGLVYAGDIAAPPMEFIDDRGQPAGIHIDLLKAMERQLGVPIAIQLMSRADATAAVREGRAHLTTIARFESREPLFDFLAPTVRIRLSVLLRSGVRPVAGLHDLAGLRITTMPGSYTHELLFQLPPEQRPELIVVTDRDAAADLWAEGGAHGMAGSGSALAWLARERGRRNFTEVPFETVMMHLATRQGCGEYSGRIDAAMQLLREQGVVDLAQERWASPGDGDLWRRIQWIAAITLVMMAAVLMWNRTLRRQVRERTHELTAALESQQRLTEHAEVATRAKSDFLATMSHEIRTPLNAVIATASLLERTSLDGGQRELVDVIRKGGDSLLSVVSDILDFSKVEAGRLELDLAPVDVRALLRDTAALIGRTAAAKGLHVYTHLDPALPQWLLGDANRLRQVVLNLLSNAVKFTESGRVDLRAAAARGDDGSIVLTVSVVDTGIGIPADRTLRIFDPFTQADSSTTRRFGGTGLGLAISRQLIKQMGGSIGVHSVPGQGSTFSISLKLVETTAPAPAATAPDIRPHWARLCVLLAEDNPVNQMVQKKILARLGMTCDVVSNGREAVEMASCNRYHVVLLDLQMPEMDGLEAARLLRLLPKPPWIVAVTADVTSDTRIACNAAGFDDFVSKPLTLDDVAAVFSRARVDAPAVA
jgi:signal transduction histidine kinase/ActR/RegA family two-component response regulator